MMEAYVTEVEGKITLVDPAASAVMSVIQEYNLSGTFQTHFDTIKRFQNQIENLNRSGSDSVILIANVDTEIGANIADIIMPNYNWGQYRDKDEIPFARGIIEKEFAKKILEIYNPDSCKSQIYNNTETLFVIVIDYGTVMCFKLI